MSRPAPLRHGQADPLSDAFAADYEAGDSMTRIAERYEVHVMRVGRTLRRRPGFVERSRSEACLLPHKPSLDRLAAQARRELELLRPARTFTPSVAAAGTSAAIHTLRAHARIDGPAPADDTRIAAAHAAGLTLDDIHEVFAVPPAEAVRAIAAHAGR